MGLFGNSTPRVRPRRQYEKNRAYDLRSVTDDGGHINGQGYEPVARMSYGLAKAGLSVCESLSIHNLLVDYGKKPDLAEIIRTADENGYLRAGGLLGMFPKDTEKMMRDYGIRYNEVTPEEAEKSIEELMRLYGIANKPIRPQLLQKYADDDFMLDRERFIAVIQRNIKLGDSNIPNPIGSLHTFLMVYDKNGEKIKDSNEIGHWIVYNRFNDSEGPKSYVDLSSVLENNSRYIKIYEILGVDSDED